jgi:glucose-1-phosphate thymidylyltransferase
MAGKGKGLLLAASTRDDELTALAGTRAAHRLPVANRPLLSYGLDAMRACGVDEVAAVVSPETAADVRELLGDGAESGLTIGCLEMGGPPTLGHALKAAEPFLEGGPVMVHLGDALVTQPLPPLFEELERSRADAILLVRNAAEFEGQGHGDGAPPLRLVEDKPVPPAEQALAGIFVFGPAAVEAALALHDQAGVREIVHALGETGGRLETRIVSGSWKYSGAVDGLLEANRMVLDELETDVGGCDLSEARIEGRVRIHPTAIVERATVRGPAVIGPHAVLQDAFVGPYSAVGAGVRLEGAELEHSIVLDNAVIRHIGPRLEDSLVGNGATVTRDFAFPSGLRLRVGRRAEVLLA